MPVRVPEPAFPPLGVQLLPCLALGGFDHAFQLSRQRRRDIHVPHPLVIVPVELALAGWEKLMAVNATSVFLGTTRAASEMAKTGGGSITNISSIMGFIGGADSHPGYSASKGAVRIFTKTAAVRFGPSGVRVNSVHPGYLPPMLNNTNAAGRASKAAVTPLRRLGEVMDVAYGVLFLASDEASFITGTELVIDGGYIAQ